MKKIKLKNYSNNDSLIQYLNEQLALGWLPTSFNKHYLYLEKSPVTTGQFFIDYSAPTHGWNNSEYIQFYFNYGFNPIANFQNKYLFYTADSIASFPSCSEQLKWNDYFKSTKLYSIINFIIFIIFSYLFWDVFTSSTYLFHWVYVGVLITYFFFALIGLTNTLHNTYLLLKLKKMQAKYNTFESYIKSRLRIKPSLVTQFLLAYLIPIIPCLILQAYYSTLNLPFYTSLSLPLICLLYLYIFFNGDLKSLKQKKYITFSSLFILMFILLNYIPKESHETPVSDTLPIVTYHEVTKQETSIPLNKESVNIKPLPFFQHSITYYSESGTSASVYGFYYYQLSKTPFLIPLYYRHHQERILDISDFKEYYPSYDELENVYIYEKLPFRIILMATYQSNFIYAELTVPQNLDYTVFLKRISEHVSTFQVE